jgi:DNA-binding transcriptional LysR family regulator
MPGLLSIFQEKHPKVKVILAEGNSREIADGLVRFKYDLGIIGRIPMDDRLRSAPFSQEEFCLVAPVDHPLAARAEVSLDELSDEPIIIREQGSGSRYAIVSLLESHQFEPSFVLEAGSVEFIKEYVIKGRGISFLYRPEIEREARQGLLTTLPIKEGPLFVQTDIVFPRDAVLSPPAQAFLDLIPRGRRPRGEGTGE